MPKAAPAQLRERHSAKPTGEQKRRQLVSAAYDIIVHHGFEGLRTRDIAATVGINIATLHYYFPTKEALVNAVADYLAELFTTVHGPSPKSGRSAALTKLHQEFADARLYHGARRDMIIALQEFSLRARRDPASRIIIERFYGYWKAGLKEMIAQGIKEGAFDASHNPQAAALFVSAAISGSLIAGESKEQLEGIFVGIEQWLTGKTSRGISRK